MKSCVVSILGAILCFALAGEPGVEKILLLKITRRSTVKEEWWIDVKRAGAIPRWDPSKKRNPPLSLEKALAIAFEAGEDGGIHDVLLSVSLKTVPGSNTPELKGFYYYEFIFYVPDYDRRGCVVMLDGSILDPTEDHSVRRLMEK